MVGGGWGAELIDKHTDETHVPKINDPGSQSVSNECSVVGALGVRANVQWF